jgi:hypothetical protein
MAGAAVMFIFPSAALINTFWLDFFCYCSRGTNGSTIEPKFDLFQNYPCKEEHFQGGEFVPCKGNFEKWQILVHLALRLHLCISERLWHSYHCNGYHPSYYLRYQSLYFPVRSLGKESLRSRLLQVKEMSKP